MPPVRGAARTLIPNPPQSGNEKEVRVMTTDEPADSSVVTQAGPWTVRSCVTASCSRCGKAPLDEDTKLTPHFTSIDQACEELPRDWGWTCVPRSNWPKDDQLLCPGCSGKRRAP